MGMVPGTSVLIIGESGIIRAVSNSLTGREQLGLRFCSPRCTCLPQVASGAKGHASHTLGSTTMHPRMTRIWSLLSWSPEKTVGEGSVSGRKLTAVC